MRDVFICDAVRTPIGRFGGSLAKVRADDLAAVPIKALMAKHPKLDWAQVDEVFFGCANQAGEDNRNVARMALLLAGIPESVPGQTLNRLCASGLDAVGAAGRAIRSGEIDFAIAGGVESMTRAPFVMGKAPEAFARSAEIYDTTIGWRFINPLMKAQYGVDAMPETGENVAEEFQVSRADQDAMATRKLMERLGIKISDFDLIELNEAFASQGIACLRQLGVKDDADFVNPHGGAIALGHPLGMSGARLALTAVHGMEKRGGKLALATMCVGVGQGVAMAIEKLN